MPCQLCDPLLPRHGLLRPGPPLRPASASSFWDTAPIPVTTTSAVDSVLDPAAGSIRRMASPLGSIPWWRGEDSNLRRHSQQIYSLPRLTASVPLRASRRAARQKSVTTPLAPASPAATAVAPCVRGVRIAVINCPARGTRARARPPSLCFSVPDTLLGIAAPADVETLRFESAESARRSAEPVLAHLSDSWSWRWDSNPQPADYKSAALPVELRQRGDGRPWTIDPCPPVSNRPRGRIPPGAGVDQAPAASSRRRNS